MNDTKKELNQRFWFLVVFSLLLLFVFAIYLPDRFYWQATSEVHDEVNEMVDEHSEAGAMREENIHGGYEYHEEKDILEGLSVNLTATPTPVRVGSPVDFNFFVNEKPKGNPIDISTLQIDNEKRMHVIGVRSDMNEFFHIHPVRSDLIESGLAASSAELTSNGVHPYPTSTPGVFTIRGIFSQPGLYKIWSEVKKDGVIHATGHPEISIEGAGVGQEKVVSFDRRVMAGDYEVNLTMEEPVEKGHEHELSFDIHAKDGEEVDVENYLGVPMHLTIIRDDWKEFLHIHPVRDGEENHQGGGVTPMSVLRPGIFAERISNGASPEEDETHMSLQFIPTARAHSETEGGENIMPRAADETINFHVTFPEAGLYKAFAQFRPRGIDLPPDEALKAEFWIRVEEEETASRTGFSSWWILLISSSIAIVVLSFAVKKFITVRPAVGKQAPAK